MTEINESFKSLYEKVEKLQERMDAVETQASKPAAKKAA